MAGLLHDDLVNAITEATLTLKPHTDRLVELSTNRPAYAHVVLEMTEAYEALLRAIVLLGKDKARYQ